jgi:hypothetical protein
VPTPASANITGTAVDFQGVYSDAVGVPAAQIPVLSSLPNAVWLWAQDQFGRYGYDLYNGIGWIEGGGSRGRANWAKDWKIIRAPIPASLWATGPYPVQSGSPNVYNFVRQLAMADASANPAPTIPGAPAYINQLAQLLTQQNNNLSTNVTSIGQAANAAANSAQTTQAAVTNQAASGSGNNTLLYIGLAVLAFFLLKKL